jgi:hypothetical protein
MAGSIYEFKSSFVTDLAKPSRFDVYIPLPLGLPANINSKHLTLRCENAELPGRTLSTAQMKIYGAEESFPYQTTFSDITLTFIVGDDMRERNLFDGWLDWINPTVTYDFQYKQNYVSDITITQYNLQNRPSYSVTLKDAFPTAINAMDLDWSSDAYHKLNVTFAYTSWKNNSAQASGQRSYQSGILDRFAGIGNASVDAGVGVNMRPLNTNNIGLTASKLGTDIPPQESLGPGESIAP